LGRLHILAKRGSRDLRKLRWLAQPLPTNKYYKYIIKKTGAVVDKFSIFIFKKLKKAIELKIMAIKNAE